MEPNMNAFNRTKTDNSISAIINRAIIGAFSVAIVGAVGVMTTVNFLSTSI